MMWTTCFAANERCGAIESTIATGPSTGTSSSSPISSSSSRCSASTRLSPELTPPPGSNQYSFPCFSCRHSRIWFPRRRIAETRIRGSAPNGLGPRRPEAANAALALGQLLDLDELDARHREHDELGDPHPRLDHEGVARVRVLEHHLHLAAV